MPKYTVLAEIHQFFEIKADNPVIAQMEAFRLWQKGDIKVDESPIFCCEEADLVEEDEATLYLADTEKKYYLIDGEFYTEDLSDPDDVCHIAQKDFSEFERSAFNFLMSQK